MKNVKRTLCLVLSLLLVLSGMSAFAATFSDVGEDVVYVDAVSSLSQLGIINGYPDGTFRPEQNVTRAEFTAMLMRSMGYGDIGATTADGLPFSDVSADNSDISWAIPNIVTSYNMGIINGYEDGTFRPSDNVLYEEAVKMIVCALGYGNGISVDVEPWYADFISTANRLSILKTAQNLGSAGTPATRACIAQILYDSLEVPIIENNTVTTKTLLSDYLGYVRNTGYIAANDVTSLTSPDVTLRENQIQIRAKEPNSNTFEVHTYVTDNAAEFKDKLGYQVEFFYDINSSDDLRTLFSCELKGNDVLELNSNNIDFDNSTSTQIKYYPDENARTTSNASLASDNIVIYNGKLYGSNEYDSTFDTSMLPEVGTVSLLDSNTDGRYEIVTINDYEVYFVSVKSSADTSIVDNATKYGSDAKTLKLDVEDSAANLHIVNAEGAEASYSSISTKNVICLAKSQENGGSLYQRAVVLNDSVSGEVTERQTGESVTIGGKSYDFSAAAPWIRYPGESSVEEPTVGTTGRFYLDILGNIVYYESSAEDASNYSYGYIMGYNRPQSGLSGDDDFQIRLLDQNNSIRDYYIYRNTTVVSADPSDPSKTISTTVSDSDELLTILEESAALSNHDADKQFHTIQQVVKYTTRTYQGRQCLDEIVVASETTSGATVENNKLNYYSSVSATEPMRYSSNRLSGDSGAAVSINNAIVFNVPSDRNDYDSYSKTTVSSSFRNNQSYQVEVFDVSSASVASVVVLFGADATTDVDAGSPVYVLTEKITQETNNEENQTMYKATGVRVNPSGSSANFEEWIASGSERVAQTLDIGAVFRAGTDRDGYLTIDSGDVLYPSDRSFVDIDDTVLSNPDWAEAEYTAIFGSVYAAEGGNVRIVVPSDGSFLEAGDTIDIDSEENFTISSSDFSSAKVYRYDTSNRDLEMVEIEEDVALGSLTPYSDGESTPSKVLLYMSEGRIKLFIVVE